MGTLTDVINDPQRRRAIVQDANHVLEQEVSDKSGLTGLAVKGAFALVKAVKPGIIPEVIESLLPEFTGAIDPILAKRPAGTSPQAYIQERANDIVQALLGVTDARAQKTSHQSLTSAYKKLRPTGEKHVLAAIPRVAALVGRFVPA